MTTAPLSSREQEICALLATGMRPKEIAQQCGISVNTVRGHSASIHRKFDVYSDIELIVLVLGTRIENLRRALGTIARNDPRSFAAVIAREALKADS